MIVEVIGVNVQDVELAAQYGADRIELCQAMQESGLTPSYGLIKQAVHAASIPIHVMVRPHSHSFVYQQQDIELMCEDIRMIDRLGADGIVIGPLTKEGSLDEKGLQQLLLAAGGLKVTIHRAFDFVENQLKALEIILKYKQITTILTAGGPKASALESIDRLIQLQEQTKGTHLTIMPGSGLQVEDMPQFYEKVKPAAVHFGTGVRQNKSYSNPLSQALIEELKRIGE